MVTLYIAAVSNAIKQTGFCKNKPLAPEGRQRLIKPNMVLICVRCIIGEEEILRSGTCNAVCFEPGGILAYQMPANMSTVQAQDEDVPRDMDAYVDSEGNAYDFCFGLNWSGVIDDERVANYKVAPLTEPETEVTFGDEA